MLILISQILIVGFVYWRLICVSFFHMMLKLDQYVCDLRAVSHKCLEFNARPNICYFVSSATKLASVVKRAHVVCNPI